MLPQKFLLFLVAEKRNYLQRFIHKRAKLRFIRSRLLWQPVDWMAVEARIIRDDNLDKLASHYLLNNTASYQSRNNSTASGRV